MSARTGPYNVLHAHTQLVTASADGTLGVWDVESGRQTRSVAVGQPVAGLAAPAGGPLLHLSLAWKERGAGRVRHVEGCPVGPKSHALFRGCSRSRGLEAAHSSLWSSVARVSKLRLPCMHAAAVGQTQRILKLFGKSLVTVR